MKIGYQGLEYSNSHNATIEIAKKLKYINYTLIGLETSKDVIAALNNGEIDFAVLAFKNSSAGIVNETAVATANKNFEQVGSTDLPISHYAFKRKSIVSNSEIKLVISHEQALKQCKNTIARLFPNARVEAVKDTAGAAEDLYKWKYDNFTVALCPLQAGEKYSLELVKANVEDNPNNRTEFRLYKLPIPIDFKAGKAKRMLFLLFKDPFFYYLLYAINFFVIFVGLRLVDIHDYRFAATLGSLLAGIFGFLVSKTLKKILYFNSITGFWKYMLIPEGGIEIEDLQGKYYLPRLLEIKENNNEFHIEGWIANNPENRLFSTTNILIKNLGEKVGKLFYEYNIKDEGTMGYKPDGVALLEWSIKKTSDIITEMEGRYYGSNTSHKGTFKLFRISESEFNAIKKGNYL